MYIFPTDNFYPFRPCLFRIAGAKKREMRSEKWEARNERWATRDEL